MSRINVDSKVPVKGWRINQGKSTCLQGKAFASIEALRKSKQMKQKQYPPSSGLWTIA
jgi:hypothetical protein